MSDDFEVDDLLFGSSVTSAALKDIGDKISGTLLEAKKVQEREYQRDRNAPVKLKTYDNGDPVMQLRLTLQTTLRDHTDDDGKRAVYMKRHWTRELGRQVKAAAPAGQKPKLTPGAQITLLRTHDEPGEGSTPKKMVSVEYRTPADQALDSTPSAAPAQTASSLPGGIQANPELTAALAGMDANALAQALAAAQKDQ